MQEPAAASVLHVDMDAFYAAVEVRRRPELAGLPVIVGGTGSRGVVAAASYEARSYGVHSAMPTARARLLCPEGVFLAGDHAYYREVSVRVMAIFGSYTPAVEALSLDEAFLDTAGAQRLFGPPVEIARRIRAEVAATEGLGCSVGAAPNKLLAKLASRQAKPRASRAGALPGPGVVCVEPGGIMAFLHPLPVGALWGVGPVTRRRLVGMGVETVGELAELPAEALVASFGEAQGRRLAELAQGRDDDPVVAGGQAKSMSSEVTFATDRSERGFLEGEVVRQADGLAGRLRAADRTAGTVVLKLRYGDFRTVTRSRRLSHATAHGPALAAVAKQLLGGLEVAGGVRLLGVGVSGLVAGGGEQLSLAEAAGAPRAVLDEAVDELRTRFGEGVIAPAGARRETDPAGPPAGSKGRL